MISVTNAIPREDVLLGLVRAEGVRTDAYPSAFEERLESVMLGRKSDLRAEEESRRAAARDILRNGVYKPTGRGKPASEYLLRAASEGDFPRINAPVDMCNYLSLKYVIPISLWDLDLTESDRFVFRLGRTGEQYVFNEGGQVIDVEDLLVGCRVRGSDHPTEESIVNPVKDSLATKTTPRTSRVAACIYAPAAATTAPQLEMICAEFGELLSRCGDAVKTAHALAAPGSTVTL